MNFLKIPISVKILCVFLSVVLAFPTPQQPNIQSNLVVPSSPARFPSQIKSIKPQITGVLTPANQQPEPSLLSSVIIDILPQISNFTRLLEPRNGVPTDPTQFVNAVTQLTYSFVQAQARDEQREVTQKEVDSILLTEAAFNITLELVKDLSQGSNIAFAIKRFTEITPRLASIGAAVQGREITQEEVEDLQEANELVTVLTPFFEELGKLNLNGGSFGSVTGNLSNFNVDVIQDYANQNLRNLRDFTRSNFQNFKDYDRLQSPDFSSDRAQEYFENNVHRVQDLTRLGLKNAETLPERLVPNGANFGKVSSQVAGIINFSDANIKGVQQINLKPHLNDEEFARRTLDVTSASDSLVDRIQKLTKPLTQKSNKNPQANLGITVNTQQPVSLLSTSPQSTSLQNLKAKQSISNPSTVQTASSATPVTEKHNLDSQALQVSPNNQNVASSTQVQPSQIVRQNAPSQTAPSSPATISSTARQPIVNQNLAGNLNNQNIARPSIQSSQAVRQSAPLQTAASSSVRQISANQNFAQRTINQNLALNQQALVPGIQPSNVNQILQNQNLIAQLNNANARVIGLVRTNGGMVPLVTIGPHSTLG